MNSKLNKIIIDNFRDNENFATIANFQLEDDEKIIDLDKLQDLSPDHRFLDFLWEIFSLEGSPFESLAKTIDDNIYILIFALNQESTHEKLVTIYQAVYYYEWSRKINRDDQDPNMHCFVFLNAHIKDKVDKRLN